MWPIDSREFPEHPIVKRAREIARTRRTPLRRLLINSTEEVTRGYVVYNDFEDYFREADKAGQLRLADWSTARLKFKIREILCEAGWERVPKKHREARFYEPRWEAVE